MKIFACHLYPDLMNIYGDRGNIIALSYRAKLRGIELVVEAVTVAGEIDPTKYDLYFFGGGQDRQQNIVAEDLKTKKEALISAINNGAALLSICGGFQLLGRYYKDQDGQILDGIGLFDCHTEAGAKRMIGNVVAETDILDYIQDSARSAEAPRAEHGRIARVEHRERRRMVTIVGFENHSGRTFLNLTRHSGEQSDSRIGFRASRNDNETRPLGKIIRGFGNNGEDKTEGIVYKNAIGTYLHGSFLPKNPEITDWLLEKAIQRKNPEFKLPEHDDKIEQIAKAAAIKRAGEVKQVSL